MRPRHLLIALPLLAGCSFTESALTKACEAEIKSRLRSPSTYERVDLLVDAVEIPVAAWKSKEEDRLAGRNPDGDLTEEDKKLIDLTVTVLSAGDSNPTLFIKFFSYDAANAYGTPVRGVSKCEYISNDGENGDISRQWLLVDGETHAEWLLSAIQKLK